MRNNRISQSSQGFDELNAAATLLRVIHAKSFAQAAVALARHPSNVSRQIALLEHHLGVQLLRRTTRRVVPTEAGLLYARHAAQLLSARELAHSAVAELSGGTPRGTLRVSMPVTVGESLLAPHLPAFVAKYPNLRLEIDLSDRDVPIVSGGFDVVIRVGKQADSSLRAQLLGKTPVRLVASPRYIAKHGSPTDPTELASHKCLTIAQVPGGVDWTFYHRTNKHRSESVRIDGAIHCSSPVLASKLAVAGMGIMRIVDWMVDAELEQGSLVEVMPQWSCIRSSEGGLPVYVVYGHSAEFSPPLKTVVFVDLVKAIVNHSRVLSRRKLARPGDG